MALLGACAGTTETANVASPSSTPTRAAPSGPETCFPPEVTARGGDAPPNAVVGPSAPRRAPVDEHGCAPAAYVSDNCCCPATEGPRFDGARCCYVMLACGCC